MCDSSLPPEDRNEHSSQMSTLDLYEDLLVSENQGDGSRILSMQEIVAEKHLLEDHNKRLLQQLVEAHQKSQNFQEEKQNMERNFNALLATAKVELARKNKLLSHYVGGSRSTPAPVKSGKKITSQAPKQKRLLALYKGYRVDEIEVSTPSPSSPALLQHRGEKMVGVATKVFGSSCDKNTTNLLLPQNSPAFYSNPLQINENHAPATAVCERLGQSTRTETHNRENPAVNKNDENIFLKPGDKASVSKGQYSVELYDRSTSNTSKNLLSQTTQKLQNRLAGTSNTSRSSTLKKVQSNYSPKNMKNSPSKKTKRKKGGVLAGANNSFEKLRESSSSTKTTNRSESLNKTGSSNIQKAELNYRKLDKKGKDDGNKHKPFSRDPRDRKSFQQKDESCKKFSNGEVSGLEKTIRSIDDRSRSRSRDLNSSKNESVNLSAKKGEERTANKSRCRYPIIEKSKSRTILISEKIHHPASLKKESKIESPRKKIKDRKREGIPGKILDLRDKLKIETKRKSIEKMERQSIEKHEKTSKSAKNLLLRHERENVGRITQKGTTEVLFQSENKFPCNDKFRVPSCENDAACTKEQNIDWSPEKNGDIAHHSEAEYVTLDTLGNDDISKEESVDRFDFHDNVELDYDENSLMHCDLMKFDHQATKKTHDNNIASGMRNHSLPDKNLETGKSKFENPRRAESSFSSKPLEKYLSENCVGESDGRSVVNLDKASDCMKQDVVDKIDDPSYQPLVRLVDIVRVNFAGSVVMKRRMSQEYEYKQKIKKRRRIVSSDSDETEEDDAHNQKHSHSAGKVDQFVKNNFVASHAKISIDNEVKAPVSVSNPSNDVLKLNPTAVERQSKVSKNGLDDVFDDTTTTISDIRTQLDVNESKTSQKRNTSKSSGLVDTEDDCSSFQTPAKLNLSNSVHKSPAFYTRSRNKIDSASIVSDSRLLLSDKKSGKIIAENNILSSNTSSLHKVKTRLEFDVISENSCLISEITHEKVTSSEIQNDKQSAGKTIGLTIDTEKVNVPTSLQKTVPVLIDKLVKCSNMAFQSESDKDRILPSNSSGLMNVAMEAVAETSPPKKVGLHERKKCDVKIQKIFRKSKKHRMHKVKREKHLPQNLSITEESNVSDENILDDKNATYFDDTLISLGSPEPSPELNKWLASASKNNKIGNKSETDSPKSQHGNSKTRERHQRDINKGQEINSKEVKLAVATENSKFRAQIHDQEKKNYCDNNAIENSYGFSTSKRNENFDDISGENSRKSLVSKFATVVEFVPCMFPVMGKTQHIDDVMRSYKNAALQFLLHAAGKKLILSNATPQPLDLSIKKYVQTTEKPKIDKDLHPTVVTNLFSRVSTDNLSLRAAGERDKKTASTHENVHNCVTETLNVNPNHGKVHSPVSGFGDGSNKSVAKKEQLNLYPSSSRSQCDLDKRKMTLQSRNDSSIRKSDVDQSVERRKKDNLSMKTSHTASSRKCMIAVDLDGHRTKIVANIRTDRMDSNALPVNMQLNKNVSKTHERKHKQYETSSTKRYKSNSDRGRSHERKSTTKHQQRGSEPERSRRDDRRQSSSSRAHRSKERHSKSRETQSGYKEHRSLNHSDRDYYHRDQRPFNKKRKLGDKGDISSNYQKDCVSGKLPEDDDWNLLLQEHAQQQHKSTPEKRQISPNTKKKSRRVTLQRVEVPQKGTSPNTNDQEGSPFSRYMWMSSLQNCQERRKKRARWSSEVSESELPLECLQSASPVTKENECQESNEKEMKSKYVLSNFASDKTLDLLSKRGNENLRQNSVVTQLKKVTSSHISVDSTSRSTLHHAVEIPELSSLSWQLSEESKSQFYSFAKVVQLLSPLKPSPIKVAKSQKSATPTKRKHVRRRVLQSP